MYSCRKWGRLTLIRLVTSASSFLNVVLSLPLISAWACLGVAIALWILGHTGWEKLLLVLIIPLSLELVIISIVHLLEKDISRHTVLCPLGNEGLHVLFGRGPKNSLSVGLLGRSHQCGKFVLRFGKFLQLLVG